MINVLIQFITMYQEYFLAQERTMEYFEKILTGLMEKMGHEHNSENMFAFLDCLLKAYIKLQWDGAQQIYDALPASSFVDWEILYQKQARILFKKEEEKKWIQGLELEKAKKEKEAKWNNLMKRRESITNTSLSSSKVSNSGSTQNETGQPGSFFIDPAE